MRHFESPLCHVNLCYVHLEYDHVLLQWELLGNFTYHWELNEIKVTSVMWTWLGLEWPLA